MKAKKRASVQAKLLMVMESKRILFAEASDGEIKKLVDNSAQRNKKIHKPCRNDQRLFALRN